MHIIFEGKHDNTCILADNSTVKTCMERWFYSGRWRGLVSTAVQVITATFPCLINIAEQKNLGLTLWPESTY